MDFCKFAMDLGGFLPGGFAPIPLLLIAIPYLLGIIFVYDAFNTELDPPTFAIFIIAIYSLLH